MFDFRNDAVPLISAVSAYVVEGSRPVQEDIYAFSDSDRPSISTDPLGELRTIFGALAALLRCWDTLGSRAVLPRVFSYSTNHTEAILLRRIETLDLANPDRVIELEEQYDASEHLMLNGIDASSDSGASWKSEWNALFTLLGRRNIEDNNLFFAIKNTFRDFYVGKGNTKTSRGLKAVEQYVPGFRRPGAVGSAGESLELWSRIKAQRAQVFEGLRSIAQTEGGGQAGAADVCTLLHGIQSSPIAEPTEPNDEAELERDQVFAAAPGPAEGGDASFSRITEWSPWGRIDTAALTCLGDRSHDLNYPLKRYVRCLDENDPNFGKWIAILAQNERRLTLERLYLLYADSDCEALHRLHVHANSILNPEGRPTPPT